MEIFAYLKPLIPNKEVSRQVDIEKEYAYYFESKERNGENLLYALQINNNLPLDQGMFTSQQVVCDYCGKQHKNTNCAFDMDDSLTLKQVIKSMKYDRDFELVVQVGNQSIMTVKPLESPELQPVDMTGGQ